MTPWLNVRASVAQWAKFTKKQVEPIELDSEEDIIFFEDMLVQRTEYIKKLEIDDICTYSSWPAVLFERYEQTEGSDMPF